MSSRSVQPQLIAPRVAALSPYLYSASNHNRIDTRIFSWCAVWTDPPMAALDLHRIPCRPQSLVGDDSGRLWRGRIHVVTAVQFWPSPTSDPLPAESHEIHCSRQSKIRSPPPSEQW